MVRILLWIAGLALLVTVMVFTPLAAPAIRAIGPVLFEDAVFAMDCRTPLVAVTIDDGPDPVSTRQILDVLEDHGARATFFVTGQRGEAGRDQLRAIARAGHELGNHTYTEDAIVSLPDDKQAESIGKTHRLFQGLEVAWFRPASGGYDDGTRRAIADYDYSIALADVYPYDHLIASPDYAHWYIMTAVQPGSVIALHDVGERGARTAVTLRHVLRDLKGDGYQAVTLSELRDSPSCGDGAGSGDEGEVAGATVAS